MISGIKGGFADGDTDEDDQRKIWKSFCKPYLKYNDEEENHSMQKSFKYLITFQSFNRYLDVCLRSKQRGI